MKVKINGVDYEVQQGITVAALLGCLKMSGDRVAIERNLNILPRSEWNATIVEPDDSYEIVHLVGGGEPDLLTAPPLKLECQENRKGGSE